MNKEYRISRISICVMVLLGSFILFINEDISFKIYGSAFLFLASLIASFVMTPLSRKEIAIGDGIKVFWLRGVYYFALFPAHIILIILGMIPVAVICNLVPETNDWGEALSQGIMLLALEVFVFFIMFVPYVQTLIVLLLRSLSKGDE